MMYLDHRAALSFECAANDLTALLDAPGPDPVETARLIRAMSDARAAAGSPSLEQRASRVANEGLGTWWHGLTDARRKYLMGNANAMAEYAFWAGALAGIETSERLQAISSTTAPLNQR
jgi:hypothetical protein